MRRPRPKPAKVAPPVDATSRRVEAVRRLAERPGTVAEGDAARPPGSPRPPDAPTATPEPGRPSPSASDLGDVLLGSRLQLERRCDKLWTCCRTGCIAVLEREDAGLTYSLTCDRCHRHLGYLPNQVDADLRQWVEAGRTSLPVLSDSQVKP
jgi:hypothetical protein